MGRTGSALTNLISAAPVRTMKHAFPCALFFSLALGALAQDAKKPASTPEQLEAARKAGAYMGASDARADAQGGKYVLLPGVMPGFNTDVEWISELLQLMPRRGFSFPQAGCGTGLTDAQLTHVVAYDKAYAEIMLKEIKTRFGDGIFVRLNAEAKALHEAKNAPKPSAPKPASPKPKKRRS